MRSCRARYRGRTHAGGVGNDRKPAPGSCRSGAEADDGGRFGTSVTAGQTLPADDLGVLRDVRLAEPRPVQKSVPLLAGGGNRELLRWAGGHVDAVGLSGLGRTLSDGHSHTVRWSAEQVDRQVALIRQGAQQEGVHMPELEALVQQVLVTDDREAAAAPLAERLHMSVEDLLSAPYVWIGSIRDIVEQIHAARHRWGITRWVVRADALDEAADIITALESEPAR